MDYKSIIESRYNRQNWQLLLHDIFGSKIKFWNTPSTIPTSSQFAKQALWLGTITLSDNQTISVYEVELSDSVDIERNRRGIRDMLLTAWRGNGNAGAFMFCYRKNESVLRFSYVSESWTFADDGSYQKESTDAKRFTYLLGEGHRSRTAIQQFEKLRDSSLTLKDLTKAFSVDAVSDMFFDGYKKQYEDIIQYITGKRMVKVANKWEEQIKNDPSKEIMQEFAHFPNPEKAVRDYVKKLMGRLVFLQFLQKKGWLGVPAGKPWGTGDREFIQNLFANCQDKDHFIDNVLEVLFNDLNTERKGDLATPSLGGGRGRLIPYLNGGLFERDATDETAFPLPAKYMQSLLDFFASYNFTIDENDPDDAEVGVDPEMLGRIFENLLEDNKDKGAFYTPKEIVSYMCRESLIAYLQTDIEDEATKEAIRQFVTTHDVNALGQNQKFLKQVDEALKNVKICDPAIGSGAFPMGLLKELFLCRTALEGIEQSKAAEIKKHIIQQNIYGVDIERGAVDIARLRFWLSLIVDEETPQALPNLDFKIMQGNSLLEQYKGVDLSNITELQQDKVGNYQTTMFDDMLDVLRLDLRKKLDEYYSCPDHKKKAILKKDIINNVKQQLKEQSFNIDFGDLDLSGNNQFMLWHTWFYDVFSQGGFDIVIGNPPYVFTRDVDFSDDFKTNIESKYFSLLEKSKKKTKANQSGKINLFATFMICGLILNKTNGFLSYILPNNILRTTTYDRIRKYLLDNTIIHQIVDLGAGVFDNVTASTIILLLQNQKDKENYVKVISDIEDFEKKQYTIKEIKQNGFNRNVSYAFNIFGDDSVSNISNKICEFNTSLGYYCRDIIEGIVAKKSIISDTMDIGCVPLLGGKNIRKYGLKGSPKYLLWDKSQIHRPRPDYLWELEKKIIIQRISGGDFPIVATLDSQKHKTFASINNIVLKDEFSNLYRLIVALLNSRIVNWYYANNFSNKSKLTVNISKTYLEMIPIPNVNHPNCSVIMDMVDKIQITDPISPEYDMYIKKIDSLVYKLYGLTEDEIAIIENNSK